MDLGFVLGFSFVGWCRIGLGVMDMRISQTGVRKRAKTRLDVVELAKAHTESAIETIRDVMVNGENEYLRLKAAESMLDRGWGKSAIQQEVKHSVQVDGMSRDELRAWMRQRLQGGTQQENADDIEYARVMDEPE